MNIPLAEHFHSLQGEGTWVGTPMHFVRLPGCSVGQYVMADFYKVKEPPPTLPGGKKAWLCHRFDDQPFWCDTDFGKYKEVSLGSLLEETWEDHICITGGEPLLHPKIIEAFIEHLPLFCTLHIETSGTIAYNYPASVWITVSPKANWLPEAVEEADELKLLVDQTFPEKLPKKFVNHPNVYLSPINQIGANPIDSENLIRCLNLLKQYPNWKLSVQLHKYLGLR